MNFTTSIISGFEQARQTVVIDWSGKFDSNSGTAENIDHMVSWIKTYPRTSDIHVYLAKAQQRQLGRKLQGALQGLGCKVTTKQYAH